MLALGNNAGDWKAKTGPKFTAEGMILDDNTGMIV
jgi:hypothetical protein